MRTARYRRIDKTVDAHDSGGIWERWRYGRLLLVDDDATTPAGNLRDGVIDTLIAASARAIEAPEDARPYDPRTTDDLARQHDRRGARLLPDAEQLAFDMFPKHDVEATLAELKRYAQEMRELTARFSARDDRRDEYLEELLEAVGGDETATLGEAIAALTDSQP